MCHLSVFNWATGAPVSKVLCISDSLLDSLQVNSTSRFHLDFDLKTPVYCHSRPPSSPACLCCWASSVNTSTLSSFYIFHYPNSSYLFLPGSLKPILLILLSLSHSGQVVTFLLCPSLLSVASVTGRKSPVLSADHLIIHSLPLPLSFFPTNRPHISSPAF